MRDSILSAYIPLLEVLPDFQNQGVGKTLIQRLIKSLDHLYMVDLCSDEDLTAFYKSVSMQKFVGFGRRNYQRQSGKEG